MLGRMTFQTCSIVRRIPLIVVLMAACSPTPDQVEDVAGDVGRPTPEFVRHQPDLFTDVGAQPNAWADYDNDQDLDLVAIGNNVESTVLFLYENTEHGLALDSPPGLIGLDLGAVSLVDYDVDGDLDLMTIGRELSSGEPRFHINDNLISQVRPNAPPEPPSFDGAIDSADVVLLSWLQATDAGDPTPQSLSYDLRMGRNPGVWDVISGVTDAGPGQVGANLFRRIEGLANGTYYWAVRTVDDGLARSEWNASRSFLIDTLPPILIGSGADSTSSDINGFKLSTDRAGIGQTLILNLVFSDQHSGVNTDVLPAVTAEIAGQRFPFEMLQFTGETWSGHLAVGATMPSGTGSIFVEGVVDNKGNIDKSMVDLRYVADSVARHIDSLNQNMEATARNMYEFSRQIRQNPGLLLGGTPPRDEARQ